MTPEQIQLLEASLDQARPHLASVAADFYTRLFAAHPDLAELFTGDPVAQQEKFAAQLEAVGRAIRDHDGFLVAAGDLGSRHRAYGVRAAHYRATGPILLESLGAALGDAWTPAVAEAWRLAYSLTAETMMAASGPCPRPPG
jgi:nitric oxide dioxygenase